MQREASTRRNPIVLWHNSFHDAPLSGCAMYEDRMVYFNCVDYGGHDHFTEEEYNYMSPEEKATIEVYPPDPDDAEDTTEYARRRPRTFRLLELSDEQIEILTNNHQHRLCSNPRTHQDHRPESERPRKLLSECKPWQNMDLSECREICVLPCTEFERFNAIWYN